LSIYLDTNTVIAIMKDRPESVRRHHRAAQRAGHDIYISTVTLFELWYGVANSVRRQENADRLRYFLEGTIGVVRFESDDAQAAGELRAELKAAGTPIGPYDLLIAAQVRRLGETLVTANQSEFKRVSGLKLRNWED
jgi:tRNA(fMet)-specific endonuclease VapC